jgi:hypothetical protein
MVQFSTRILDELTAPKLSLLTACGAPEIPELPGYDMAIRLKQALGPVKYKREQSVTLLLTFIGRLRTAIGEFNQGRAFLQQYVNTLPNSHLLDHHRKAVAHFENSILQLHVSVYTLASFAGGIKNGKGKPGIKQLYVENDGTDYDRLRKHNNSIKHFDENVADAVRDSTLIPIAPIWITNDGFECTKKVNLSFAEVAAIFEDQATDAKNFSEPEKMDKW